MVGRWGEGVVGRRGEGGVGRWGEGVEIEHEQGHFPLDLFELEPSELLGCWVHECDEAQFVHHEQLVGRAAKSVS